MASQNSTAVSINFEPGNLLLWREAQEHFESFHPVQPHIQPSSPDSCLASIWCLKNTLIVMILEPEIFFKTLESLPDLRKGERQMWHTIVEQIHCTMEKGFEDDVLPFSLRNDPMLYSSTVTANTSRWHSVGYNGHLCTGTRLERQIALCPNSAHQV